MPLRKKPLIGVLLFGGVFVYLAFEVIRHETGNLRGGSASQNWPTVDGQIISSTIETKHTSGDSTRYYTVVEFEYSVDGTSFQGDRVYFGMQPTTHRSTAEDISRRYSVGRIVPVFYDPEDAQNSVLEPGTSSQSWMGIGVGILFVLFAGRMLFARLRQTGS